MARPILEVSGVSKKFLLNHQAGGYLNLRDSLLSLFQPSRWSKESFYALKDVTFQVNQGDSLAIIGRNGAGKSTLLKILSRITPPSGGNITSRGRVSSLLEVGTGFHPELSGRENIFFNGSLLGMKRTEIQQKFDEIVEFSGTQKFLDTPLKHFSSGMQLRLAFSVAAFLESEILILDEVLAVGDAEFQKKCIGKIDDVTRSGRTIIFVSHNMSVVRSLCNTAVVLANGTVQFQGEVNAGIDHYLASAGHEHSLPGVKSLIAHPNKKNPATGMTEVRLLREGKPTNLFFTNEAMCIQIDFAHVDQSASLVPGLVIKDMNQQALIGINNNDLGIRLGQPAHSGTINIELAHLPVYGNSTYFIDLFLTDASGKTEVLENAITFHTEARDVYGKGKVLSPKVNSIFAGPVKMSLGK